MKKKLWNICLLCLFLIFVFGVSASASAASFRVYTISSGNTRVYGNAALSSASGWIYGSDEVTVLEFGSNYCKVNYPISGNRTKNGYVPFHTLFTSPTGTFYTSRAKITTYRRPNGSAYGYIAKNDSVLVMGTNGSYTQVRYPAGSDTYKFAFIKTSDCNNYIKPAPAPVPPSGGSAGSHVIPDGWYMIVSGNSDNRVLDINNWNQNNGGNLETYAKNNSTNQRFQLVYLNNGYYAIKVLHSGRYLHVADGNNKTSNVHQWQGYNTSNAQWALKSAGNGYYYLQNRANGSYLDNSNASTSLGNNVITYPYNGSYAQKWKFLSTSDGYDERRTLPDGWYEIRSANNNSYVWDINAGVNSGLNDGANLEIYPRHGGNNQKFYLRYLNNGYYAIMAGHSNKYLHKENSGYKENVLQWTSYSTSAIQTQWAIASAGSGYYVVRAKAGNYVDNSGGTVRNGNNVITYMWNGSNAQKWKFVSTGAPSPAPQPSSNVLVAESEINNAAGRYGISSGSNAYKALTMINSKYYSRLSGNKNGINIFLFEGVGNNASAGARMNAMCVVVSGGKIVYINRNSSTIPDYPFNPSKNDGTPMPTLKDGIYGFTTVNHRGKYAALNVSGAKVVRFKSRSDYYNDSSSAINVHRRSTDYIAPSDAGWVNSSGCQLIGRNSEYLSFIKAVGIVSGNSVTKYTRSVTGKIIIDRSFASTYLSNVGYYANAINMIRG
ncbi:MAG: RICIN domain-containing protein [Blautia sp.]|nr:RICIN domain-containing protein [Blautia sp.]